MITWILILTLYTDGYYSGAGSVTAVNGFASKSQCEAAGKAWTTRQRAERQKNSTQALDVSANAMCVPSTKETNSER